MTSTSGPQRAVQDSVRDLVNRLEDAVLGQQEVVAQLLSAYLAGGHVLLEGVPGIGKTLLARSFARLLGVDFTRIQFTPDLMPSDVVGVNVFDSHTKRFNLQKGPIFTGVLMADEINRTPPKTQSALLEGMEERQVSIDGVTHRLPEGFFVVATQNPLEFEGVYPLPEAQLDRFMLRISMPLPSEDAELEVYRRAVAGTLARWADGESESALSKEEAATLRSAALAVHVRDDIVEYAGALAKATRDSSRIELGASPRAGIHLLQAARGRALVEGRDYVVPDDLKRLVPACWGHRLVLSPESELEGFDTPRVLGGLVNEVEVPQ